MANGGLRPGKAGRRGLKNAMASRNFVNSPAGGNPARPRVSPPRLVASLATSAAMRAAMRRRASMWAVGNQPRKSSISARPRGSHLLKATASGATEGERRRRGGVSDHGTYEQEGPGTWETRRCPWQDRARDNREPSSPGPRVSSRRRGLLTKQRTSEGAKVSRARGRTAAAAQAWAEVGGPNKSDEVGEQRPSWTLRSKGGPC